jgi:putative hydrolase of the HAD superfamily
VGLRAVLLDLGDVIMREETEQKIDDVTQGAELVPGIADLLHRLHDENMPLALVADTRIGTYKNVLYQHGLYGLFDAFAISDEVGCEKPDPRIFEHALEMLGIPRSAWSEVAMVGNNLARDIRGANAIGLISIWIAWNQRYPTTPADDAEKPRYQVGSAAQLGALLDALRSGSPTHEYTHPRPFPWEENEVA